MSNRPTIVEFELIDHGIDNCQYFQGCGVSFTSFENVATGCGSNFAEAVDDCLDQVAQFANVDDMEKRILKDIGKRTMPRRPAVSSKHSEECYYYVSIRYNVAG